MPSAITASASAGSRASSIARIRPCVAFAGSTRASDERPHRPPRKPARRPRRRARRPGAPPPARRAEARTRLARLLRRVAPEPRAERRAPEARPGGVRRARLETVRAAAPRGDGEARRQPHSRSPRRALARGELLGRVLGRRRGALPPLAVARAPRRARRRRRLMERDPEAVLAFWFGDAASGPEAAAQYGDVWFRASPELDARIRDRFLAWIEA